MMRSRGLASRSHGLACAAAVQRGRDAQRPFLLALVLARLAVLVAVFFAGRFAAVLVALAFAFLAIGGPLDSLAAALARIRHVGLGEHLRLTTQPHAHQLEAKY